MLPKDFLSIEDVADYLNFLGWSYDLSVSRDHYKLHKDIYDLIVQGKISLVFHHTGHIKETVCDNDIDEVTGKLKNCTSKTIYTSAYFIIYPALAREMLLDDKFTTTQGRFNLYSFQDGKKNPDVTHTLYLYDILDDNEQNITASDLYIPKNEIDKLFNENNQIDHEQTIEKLESELAQVNAELDALKKQADTPANDSVLQTILNDSHEDHAPDLKHAIHLWIDLYINKDVGGGSHSAMANHWIYANTGYDSSENSSPVKRLREITTPFKDFGGQRPKEVKK